MRVLDKSVETLGLWIVSPRLHSLNRETRVAPAMSDCLPGCFVDLNIEEM